MRRLIYQFRSDAVDFVGQCTIPPGQRGLRRLTACGTDQIHDRFCLGEGKFSV